MFFKRNIMTRRIVAFFLCLSLSSVCFARESPQLELVIKSLDHRGLEFANLEHQKLGNSVSLKLSLKGVKVKQQQLLLSNGMQVSYGDIVSLAGDLFGDPANPIAQCKKNQKGTCFLKQFADLNRTGTEQDKFCQSAFYRKNEYFKVYADIRSALEDGMQHGQSNPEVYKGLQGELNKRYNRISCGGSKLSALLPFGGYINLASVNFDHFYPDSVEAYKVGHKLALNSALKAYHAWHQEYDSTKAHQLLQVAYAQNAFASHFLTDSFSSGHMRVPRLIIHNKVFLMAPLKLLLANFMHDEDNNQGLNVINSHGQRWHAYGDGHLFTPKASKQRHIMINALQISADDIFATFKTGVIPNIDSTLSYLPKYELIESMNETTPLFKVANNKLLLRKDLLNHYSSNYTKYWSGLITFITLEIISGK